MLSPNWNKFEGNRAETQLISIGTYISFLQLKCDLEKHIKMIDYRLIYSCVEIQLIFYGVKIVVFNWHKSYHRKSKILMNSTIERFFKELKGVSIKTIITCILLGYIAGFAVTLYWHIYISETNKKTFNSGRWLFFVLLLFFVLVLLYGRSVRQVYTFS